MHNVKYTHDADHRICVDIRRGIHYATKASQAAAQIVRLSKDLTECVTKEEVANIRTKAERLSNEFRDYSSRTSIIATSTGSLLMVHQGAISGELSLLLFSYEDAMDRIKSQLSPMQKVLGMVKTAMDVAETNSKNIVLLFPIKCQV